MLFKLMYVFIDVYCCKIRMCDMFIYLIFECEVVTKR